MLDKQAIEKAGQRKYPVLFPSEHLMHPVEDIPPEDFENGLAMQLYKVMARHLIGWSGFGLSANQIGLPYNAFVMVRKHIPIFMANVEIDKRSPELWRMSEGCLSMGPGFAYFTERNTWVIAKYLNEYGNQCIMDTREYPIVRDEPQHHRIVAAQCIQHELQHLDGTLLDSISRTKLDQMYQKLRRYKKQLSKSDINGITQAYQKRLVVFEHRAKHFLDLDRDFTWDDLPALLEKVETQETASKMEQQYLDGDSPDFEDEQETAEENGRRVVAIDEISDMPDDFEPEDLQPPEDTYPEEQQPPEDEGPSFEEQVGKAEFEEDR